MLRTTEPPNGHHAAQRSAAIGYCTLYAVRSALPSTAGLLVLVMKTECGWETDEFFN